MEVYLATSTGEYFSSYEEYVERVALYSQPVWTCKLTGHTGLTYPDALQSEEAARRSLELFPEWWKPYSLSAIHCSTESIDMLATRIGNYCRDHLALNEPVRLTFNDVMYEGIVSVAPKFDDETSTRPSSLDAAPYRIAINDGEMIMTGACKGPEDVQ